MLSVWVGLGSYTKPYQSGNSEYWDAQELKYLLQPSENKILGRLACIKLHLTGMLEQKSCKQKKKKIFKFSVEYCLQNAALWEMLASLFLFFCISLKNISYTFKQIWDIKQMFDVTVSYQKINLSQNYAFC